MVAAKCNFHIVNLFDIFIIFISLPVSLSKKKKNDNNNMEFEDKLELIDEKITSTTILSIPKLTPKLTHLNLAHNRIDFLPDSLFLACPNLNHLNLYGNCIQEIPKGIRNLSDLKWLNIGKFCTTKYSQFNLTKKKILFNQV